MLNQKLTLSRTQATGLGVMISKCSRDSRHGRPDGHPANIGYSFFRYTIQGSTLIKDVNIKDGLEKTTNLHYPAILGATLHKEDIGKE